MSSQQRIAITGVSGMVGQVVARRLAKGGHELVMFDRRRTDATLPQGTFIECDLRERDRVAQAIAGVRTVIHIGEIPNVGNGYADSEVFESNVAACRSMLDAAVAAGARRFIYTSSCQYYGYWGNSDFDRERTPARWPIDEFQPAMPRNAYAHSKAMNELACLETSARTGLEVFMFRLPWVVPHHLDQRLRDSWSTSDPRHVDGFWTYVHVDDAAEAYALGAADDRPLEPMPSRCEAFHFASDESRGPLPVREKLAKFTPGFHPLPEDWPPTRPPLTCAKAARYLGWHPQWRMGDLLRNG
jgi:UDP-glucose 4-epimerase